MIQFTLGNGGKSVLTVRQSSVWPMVYLDHCAWRSIADDDELSARLTDAIRRKQGTLALSWINIAEYSKVLDAAQVGRAEAMLEGVLPNIFFIESNPFTVSNREAAWQPENPAPPHEDREFLASFVRTSGGGLRLISAVGIFSLLQASNVPASLADLARTTAVQVQALADAYANDPEFTSRVNSGNKKRPGAALILQELIRTYLIDGKSQFDDHDAIDLMHASVPNAYCDFVVLDGEWRHRSEQIRPRLQTLTGGTPPASTYSASHTDLARFISDLEEAQLPKN